MGGAGAGAARSAPGHRGRRRPQPARPAGGPRAQAGAAARRRGRAPRSASSSRSPSARPTRCRCCRGHGVEAVALVAYGLLVPRAMLDAFPFVNLHPSALPRWRGAAPVERSLMAGERASAVAAMLLVEKLDAGPVAALERFDVGPDEDAGAVYERALSLGLPPLAAALADAGAGRLATVPQVGEPTYADKLTAADRVLDPGTARARAARPRARAVAAHRRAPAARRARLTRSGARPCASDGPGAGHPRARRRRARPGLRRRCAGAVRRAAAGRPPHARSRLAARPAAARCPR